MEKCQCYIHSLKQGENHVLGEATILKRLGEVVSRGAQIPFACCLTFASSWYLDMFISFIRYIPIASARSGSDAADTP